MISNEPPPLAYLGLPREKPYPYVFNITHPRLGFNHLTRVDFRGQDFGKLQFKDPMQNVMPKNYN